MLRAASAGDTNAKSTFARSYTAPIRAYLGHRWRDTPFADSIDNAVQDVFVACMKPGGVLDHANQELGDFRALLETAAGASALCTGRIARERQGS